MMTGNSIVDRATMNQHRAADPENSVWVSANAGTGKTRVLTTRILRILINGARISEIMAVTYTRAAAAEMRNRIYDNLAQWAVIDESELTARIVDLGIARPSQKQITTARSLFARLLDAPMAIRIETVHAFCQSVLRRFPFEAGIQPYFELASEMQVKALQDDAIMDVLASADSDVQAALARIAESVAETDLMTPVMAMFKYEKVLARIYRDPVGVKRDLFSALSCLDAVDDPEAMIVKLRQELVAIPNEGELRFFAAKCAEGSKVEHRNGIELAAWLDGDHAERMNAIDDYRSIFLTNDMTVKKQYPTKKLIDQYPEVDKIFKREGERLITMKQRSRAIETATLTAALYQIAGQIFARYQRRKAGASLMDYDDLIMHTSTLLGQDGGVSWVRYKLDEGITHLLIDEAQDTSPAQWEIMNSLAAEFFTGDEDRDQGRSIFSVGDYKQSIYSFQGARPELFNEQRISFKSLAGMVNKPFDEVDLDTSFRTTAPILALVDKVIKPEDGPMPGIGDSVPHQVSRNKAGGFIELLDAEPFLSKDDTMPDPYTTHRDDTAVGPDYLLARRITQMLNDWIGKKDLPAHGRKMRAGDVMILLRNRDKFAKILDRELRRSGLPIAGADKVKLIDEIAVMDLLALGQVMMLPEDDLNLAAVLKAPFFGCAEDALYDLAHGRGQDTIQQRLAALAPHDARFTEIHRRLTEWLGLAEIMPPSQFFRHVLSPETTASFMARLGRPVVDVFNEFLKKTHEFEHENAPSMQRFILSMRDTELEVKREVGVSDADEIRIMTMHGAKGLEAPVVVLPSLIGQSYKPSPLVEMNSPNGPIPIAPPSGKFQIDGVSDAKKANKQAWEEEENRLLYVAMTRAEDGLVIAGYGNSPNVLEGSYYQMIRSAMHDDAFADYLHPNDDKDGVVITTPQREVVTPDKVTKDDGNVFALPSWFHADAPAEETPPRPLSPSRYAAVPSAHSPTGQVRKRAMLRGSLTHRLLEILPGLSEGERLRAASRIITPMIGEDRLTAEDADAAQAETIRLISDPALAEIFGPDARAEVPVSGMIGSDVVSGVIDRLVISDDAVTIIDFKTGPSPKDGAAINPSYIAQQAIYAHVLSQIWQDRAIHAGLIYTEDASLHWLDNNDMARMVVPLLSPET